MWGAGPRYRRCRFTYPHARLAGRPPTRTPARLPIRCPAQRLRLISRPPPLKPPPPPTTVRDATPLCSPCTSCPARTVPARAQLGSCATASCSAGSSAAEAEREKTKGPEPGRTHWQPAAPRPLP